MIRIRFVVHVAAHALPSLTPFTSFACGSVAVLFASQRLCFFRYLRSLRGSARDYVTGLHYIGLVVIVNAVFSKLGVVT